MSLLCSVLRQSVARSGKQIHRRFLKSGTQTLSYSKCYQIRKNIEEHKTVSLTSYQISRNLCLSGVIHAPDTNGNGKTKLDVTYEELVSLIESSNIQLFDVREPKELKSTGQIPTAVNIPLSKLKTFLSQSSAEELDVAFNVPIPKKEDENIVFYGLKDVKGATALEIAHKLGFRRARHFPGGWMEWEEKQK